MPLLSRKGLLAVAAVIDVALQPRGKTLSAKALADRHGLPARHLEPVLQALVHQGILKGVRGPRGGYALARERGHISAGEILRAIGSIDDSTDRDMPPSALLDSVVRPAVLLAEQAFATALATINLDDLAHRAESLQSQR